MSAKSSSAPRSHSATLAAGTKPRLRDRRRAARRRLWLAGALLLLLIAAGCVWGLNQPALRVSHIEVVGAEHLLPGASPEELARMALKGSTFGLVPHDSTLFFAGHRVRAAILSAHPEIAALSIGHMGVTSVRIRIAPRTAVGRWCGSTYSPPSAAIPGEFVPYCYLYDPSGFVYSALPDPLGIRIALLAASTTVPAEGEAAATTTATTTLEAPAPEPVEESASPVETLNSFALYAPLVGNVQEPLGATISRAAQLPGAFAFARRLADFGPAVQAVVVRGDEVDDLLASGTRITYVLGHEEDALSALASAKEGLELTSGALEYVDLRFPGKVYLKKRGE